MLHLCKEGLSQKSKRQETLMHASVKASAHLRFGNSSLGGGPGAHAIMHKQANAVLQHPQHLSALDHPMQREALIYTRHGALCHIMNLTASKQTSIPCCFEL